MTEERPRPAVIGPSRAEKRRNRRRKSKYARPLISIAHGAVLLQLLLAAGFVAALLNELVAGGGGGGGPAVQDEALSGLNLPGDAAPARRRGAPPGVAQLLLWAYLFGAPALFAAQRLLFWRRTIFGLRLLTYMLAAIWVAVIVVLGVLVSQT